MLYSNVYILSISRGGQDTNVNISSISMVGQYFEVEIWTILSETNRYGPSIWSVWGVDYTGLNSELGRNRNEE